VTLDDSIYVLDANVFIQAKRKYYAFDLAPGFWDSLVDLAEHGRIESIDRVKKELYNGRDELTEWANNYFSDAFISTNDEEVIQAFRLIMAWVNQGEFLDAAISEFAAGADGWLVAYAMTKGRIVVTQEVLNPNIKRRVPIPNVCQGFNMSYVTTFEMLRALGVRWIS